jgi:hypothetical protein
MLDEDDPNLDFELSNSDTKISEYTLFGDIE